MLVQVKDRGRGWAYRFLASGFIDVTIGLSAGIGRWFHHCRKSPYLYLGDTCPDLAVACYDVRYRGQPRGATLVVPDGEDLHDLDAFLATEIVTNMHVVPSFASRCLCRV